VLSVGTDIPTQAGRRNTMKTISTKTRPTLDQLGQGLSEYLILVVLIAVTSIAAVQSLGKLVKEKIQTARRHINSGVVIDQ
jgi:Flp pilus assembly pilin Flp